MVLTTYTNLHNFCGIDLLAMKTFVWISSFEIQHSFELLLLTLNMSFGIRGINMYSLKEYCNGIVVL